MGVQEAGAAPRLGNKSTIKSLSPSDRGSCSKPCLQKIAAEPGVWDNGPPSVNSTAPRAPSIRLSGHPYDHEVAIRGGEMNAVKSQMAPEPLH